jgi:hypothetical protein
MFAPSWVTAKNIQEHPGVHREIAAWRGRGEVVSAREAAKNPLIYKFDFR